MLGILLLIPRVRSHRWAGNVRNFYRISLMIVLGNLIANASLVNLILSPEDRKDLQIGVSIYAKCMNALGVLLLIPMFFEYNYMALGRGIKMYLWVT
jgi:hypothetical protein